MKNFNMVESPKLTGMNINCYKQIYIQNGGNPGEKVTEFQIYKSFKYINVRETLLLKLSTCVYFMGSPWVVHR